MPKIQIKEKDLTSGTLGNAISNTVFIPIKVDSGKAFEPTLFTSLATFKDFISGKVTDNLAAVNMCKHLLNLGFDILVQGVDYVSTTVDNKYWSNISDASNSELLQAKIKATGDTATTSDVLITTGSQNKNTNEGLLDDIKYFTINFPNTKQIENFDFICDVKNLKNYSSLKFYISLEDNKQNPNTDGLYTLIVREGSAARKVITTVNLVDSWYIVEIPINNLNVDKLIFELNVNSSGEDLEIEDIPNFNISAIQGLSNIFIDWTSLEDKNKYDIRFLTNGLFEEDFPLDMVKCAKNRGDCIALCNINEAQENYIYNLQTVRECFTSKFAREDPDLGQYAAGFTPWFYTTNSDFTDNKNEKVKIPAAFGYLFAYANAIKNNPEWYAIAGFDRGVIPELDSVFHDYSSADIEVLQSRAASGIVDLDKPGDNAGVSINPIAYIRPAGYIIYGNRTLKNNSVADSNVGSLTATSFLNVRNGVSAIKKVMYEAARKYTFEQNNEILWANFQAYIRPLLDKMQAGNGILGYKFIRLKTDAKARLKAQLKIIPIEAVEDFELEVKLVDDLTVSE